MKQLANPFVLAVFLAGCAATSAQAGPAKGGSDGVSSARLRALTSSVRDDVKNGVYPGAVMMLVRDGNVVLSEAIGVQDPRSGTPMKADSIFRIASMTKPIVSVGTMILVEEGKILLSDPVSRWLPELKGLKVGLEKKDASGADVLEEVPAQREMTVQDLLRHTSGLTYGIFGRSLVKQKYVDANFFGDPALTLAEFVRRLSKLPLAYQPGTTWEYSHSTDVLGAVLEKASGQPLDVFLAQRIFGPLGMKDTGFSVDAAKHGRIAEPFEVDPDTKAPARVADVRNAPSFLSGGSGLVSTAADYARFAQMLLNGGELDGVRILSRKTVEFMTSDQLGPGIARNALYFPGPGYGFGLGVAVRTSEGGPAAPGSVGDYTWSGASGTNFFVDPKERLVWIWMMQRPNMTAGGNVWRKYRSMVYGALE
jgi:CubicO group peptidase (beta-lactamase class C family)